MIKKFSPEVIVQLNYYVYRLIDPRNGQTFYVGKGKGNRVFQHVQGVIRRYDKGEDVSDDDPNKMRIIKEIINEGLEVIHIIQRWNLSEKEALEVEAALIDAYQGLSNLQSGHHFEYGVSNAEVLQKRFSRIVYEEPSDFKYIIFKIRFWRLEELFNEFPVTFRYESTRRSWKIKPRSIRDYPYAFSVTDGIVKEVYKINKWNKDPNSPRYAFDGEIAEETVRERFVNTRIPDAYCKKGMASPVLFSKK